MTRIFLTASVAALALAAPANAGPGGKERGPGASARAETKVQRSDGAKARVQARAEFRQQRAEKRVEGPRMQRVERRTEAPRMQRVRQESRLERRAPRQIEPTREVRNVRRQVDVRRTERRERRVEQAVAPRKLREEARTERVRERPVVARNVERRAARIANHDQQTPRGLPQLLGRHDMGRHLGQLKRAEARPAIRLGERIDPNRYSDRIPTRYRTRYADTPDYYYRYDDDRDYLYRIARRDNVVSSLIPLFGYGYGVGDAWPDQYRTSYAPLSYRSLYYDTPDNYYRYADDAIYRVDPTTQLITGIVALLTGQSLGVGQMLPSSYGVYNVPYAYRSNYYDTADNWYRYGDGMIYQVDPYSRRIEAAYPLYGNDYMVGSRWPTAYPDYNVPYGYRDLYYDTPQYDYRFANGGIYQVDPKNQLIQALVSMVTGQQFGIGQQMPAGYGVYNVPYNYRDRYYDTANDWYRYNDGYVYRVDPRSGLIEDRYAVYA